MTVIRLLPRFSCIVALILGLSVEVSLAQSLKRSAGPSELPPHSFQGKQFVDSKGCAYIRAGYGARVTWVPRVSRSRKILCGFRPTFVASVPQEPETKQTVRRVVQPKIATVRKVQSVAGTRKVVDSDVAPNVSGNSQIAPLAPPVDKLIAPCVGARSFSSQFINNDTSVRCGPQTLAPRASSKTKALQREIESPYRGPKGTNQRIATARSIKVPKGYGPAHKDGRLNPLRGVGTVSGQAQMAAIWSNTVPRYLIDPATGKRLR